MMESGSDVSMLEHAWVEVDLDALQSNFRTMAEAVGGVKILAVVKADGYGHGAAEVARTFLQAGAWGVGVCHLEEARQLRQGGVDGRILVFAPLTTEQARLAVDLRVIPTLTSLEPALALAEYASAQRCGMGVHVAVETGLGRFGVEVPQVASLVEGISQVPGLTVEGVYTHLATDDADLMKIRMERLEHAVNQVRSRDLFVPMVHAAGSGPALKSAQARMDMVRLGTALYGLPPYLGRVPGLRSAWSLRSRISVIREMFPGETVGYAGDHEIQRKTRLAVVPVGFADGFMTDIRRPVGSLRVFLREAIRGLYHAFRSWRRPERIWINGSWAPVIGRVGMQHLTADVTGVEGVREGDEVSLPAREVVLSPLIPRVYVRDGQVVGVVKAGERIGAGTQASWADGSS